MTSKNEAGGLPFSDLQTSRANKGVLAFAIIFFLLLNFQDIRLLQLTTAGSSLRLYHLFSLLGIPILFENRARLSRWNCGSMYLAAAVIANLVAYWRFGFNSLFVQLCFAVYMFYLGQSVRSHLGKNTMSRVISAVFAVVCLAVALKLTLSYGTLAAGGFYGATSSAFYAGGPNIEASWVGLCPILFESSGMLVLLPFCTAIYASLMYGSRAGLFALAWTSVAYIFLCVKRRAVIILGAVVTALVIVCASMGFFAKDLVLFQRLAESGTDSGMDVGREILWVGASQLLSQNLFGYGVGNVLPLIEQTFNRSLPENNVHNIYLQMLLDSGLLPAGCYVALVASVIRRSVFRSDGELRIGLFLIGYWILACVQFTGFESMFWYLLGIYYGGKASGCSSGIPAAVEMNQSCSTNPALQC